MATSIDQQFVEYIVKSLVNNPDGVKIDRRIDEKGVLLELTVDADDLGRVIGKRGATAQSLRTLLRALGTKNEARYNLKIVDVDKPESERGVSAGLTSDDTDDDGDRPQEASVKPAEAGVSKSAKRSKPAADAKTADNAGDSGPEDTGDTTSDTVSRTRKELAELDDLDIQRGIGKPR